MKEIVNETVAHQSKRLYYKKVAAILLVALLFFLGYSFYVSMNTEQLTSVNDNFIWNKDLQTCGDNLVEKNDNSCGGFGWKSNPSVLLLKNPGKEEIDFKMNLAREMEELQFTNESGSMILETEFFDL